MAWVAVGLIAIWMTVVAVARGAVTARTRDDPVLRFGDPVGSPAWWARLIGAIAFVLLVLAPVAELLGFRPLALLDRPAVKALGVTITVVGIGGTVYAQAAMGASWRGDVDADARTALVTTGPFRLVRNPILSCTQLAAIGIVLVVPNAVAGAMLVAMVTSHEIQVRLVEEPYLLRVHDEAYRTYAARTGRFIPGVGRIRAASHDVG